MIANEKCNLPFGLWKVVSKLLHCCRRHWLRSSSQRYHLSPVTLGQLGSLHATIMALSQLQEVGEHTLVNQIRLFSPTRRTPKKKLHGLHLKKKFWLKNVICTKKNCSICAKKRYLCLFPQSSSTFLA